MAHVPIRVSKAWTQETDDGFLVKVLTNNGKTLFLKRLFKNVYDFVSTQELATFYKEPTADLHVREINKNITRRKFNNTFLLMDNRIQADLLFVMLINGNQYGGLFDRAERAEEAVNAYNSLNNGNKATYINVTDSINTTYSK